MAADRTVADDRLARSIDQLVDELMRMFAGRVKDRKWGKLTLESNWNDGQLKSWCFIEETTRKPD